MDFVEEFKRTGIPPKYGYDKEQYQEFLSAVDKNRDKIQVTADNWEKNDFRKDGSKKNKYHVFENRLFPEGFPTLTLINCFVNPGFSDVKVKLNDKYNIYLPMLMSNPQNMSEELVTYAVRRTQRRNMFGKEIGRDNLFSVAQNPNEPRFDKAYTLFGVLSAGLFAFLAAYPLFYVDTAGSMVVILSELLSLPFLAYGLYNGREAKNIYQKGKQLAGTAGPEFVEFMPAKDIKTIVDGNMKLGEIREYTEKKFNETGYVSYEIAANLIK